MRTQKKCKESQTNNVSIIANQRKFRIGIFMEKKNCEKRTKTAQTFSYSENFGKSVRVCDSVVSGNSHAKCQASPFTIIIITHIKLINKPAIRNKLMLENQIVKSFGCKNKQRLESERIAWNVNYINTILKLNV